MRTWVTDAGIFAVAAVFGCIFLLLRCRRIGNPFGPRARWWAIMIVLVTAMVSTAIGAGAVYVDGHIRAAVVAIVLPSGLWLGQWSAQQLGERRTVSGTLLGWLTLPLRRLDDRMGDDMQDWCDARSRGAARSPELTADAANHYYLQVVNQLKDLQVREDLDHWRNSIAHKTAMARRAGRDTPELLRIALGRHPATRDARKYPADDPDRLAGRLRSEAENELHLMLAYLYRLGYRKLLTYGGYTPKPSPRSSPSSTQSAVARP
jgi:hypothetical protein